MTNRPWRLAAIVIATTAAAFGTALPTAAAAMDDHTHALVSTAIEGKHRSEQNRARDVYRKPLETLAFFGLSSDMTVVEIWPGGGWYSEILAPVLKDEGLFYAAQYDPNGPYGYQRRGLGAFLTRLGNDPDIYRNVVITRFDLPYALEIAPRGSADMVLTFRNVHNLYMDLYGGGVYAHLAFQAMYDALKPGGVLGVVDHRWDDPDTEDPLSANGYISVQRTVALAESAGFKLDASSDLLANPKDSKDHPSGVWTLPPSYALGDENRQRYTDIGESDRFVLRFVKPAQE
jgi:predicted methyltransferase